MKKPNKLLILMLALIIWGPPSIRFTKRSLGSTLQDPTNLDLTIFIQLLIWFAAGLLVAIFFFRQILLQKSLLPQLIKRNPTIWYFIYGIIALFSTLYSVLPPYTFFFSIKIVIAILLVGYWVLASENQILSIQQLLKIFYTVFILQGLAIILIYFINPKFVGGYIGRFGYRLTGGSFSDYGNSMVIAGLFFLTLIFYGKKKYRLRGLFGYIFAWYFLLLSQTRSTIFAGILIFLLFIFFNQDLNKKLKWIWSLSIFALVIFWIGYFDPIIDFITRGKIAFDTLSGRTIAFSYLFERWREAPFLGYGFAAGTRVHLFDFVKVSGLGMGDAHDSLSKVLIDLGIVGLIPLLLAVIFTWKNLLFLLRNRNRLNKLENSIILQLLCMFLLVFVQSIVGGTIAALSVPFIITMVSSEIIRKKYIRDNLKSRANSDIHLKS